LLEGLREEGGGYGEAELVSDTVAGEEGWLAGRYVSVLWDMGELEG